MLHRYALNMHLVFSTTHIYHNKLISAATQLIYTLSDRIGKVVASHATVARSSPAEVALIYTMHCPRGGGCDQSIGSTVSDDIVRIWLWLTETRSSPLGCFSTLLQVDEN